MAEKSARSQRQEEITQRLAQEFISCLSEGQLPWSHGFDRVMLTPHNPASGTVYAGTSRLILLMENHRHGYGDPRWMTFNQAKQLGASVMKGEKATWCVRWQPIETEKNSYGQIQVDDEGNPIKHQIMIPCPYAVFNVRQIKDLNLPPLEVADHQWDPNERAETLIRNSGAVVVHDKEVFSACYRPISDDIRMPTKGQFHDAVNYYDTLLHELCHWTGHKSRLNRYKENETKTDYAKEELRAEIGSSILSATLGIDHIMGGGSDEAMRNHKAYIQSWVKNLNDNPKEILYATAQADKIVTWLRQFDPVKDPPLLPLLKQNHEKVPAVTVPELKKEVKQDIDTLVKELNEGLRENTYRLTPIEKSPRDYCATYTHRKELPDVYEQRRMAIRENVRQIKLADGRNFLAPVSNADFYEINAETLKKPNMMNLANRYMSREEIGAVIGQARKESLMER